MDRSALPRRVPGTAGSPAPPWTYDGDPDLIARVVTALQDSFSRHQSEPVAHHEHLGGDG